MNKEYYLLLHNTTPDVLNLAKQLIKFTNQFKMIICDNVVERQLIEMSNVAPVYLSLDHLGLRINCESFQPIEVADFYNKMNLKRIKLSNELIIKATHSKAGSGIDILDLTAGLGIDAFLMARFGYNVNMIEKNPLLATVLYYAKLHDIFPSNLNVIYGDSLEVVCNQEFIQKRPDIVYMDPMFLKSRKSKAKKIMQIIQFLNSFELVYEHNEDLASTDETAKSYNVQLFDLALRVARQKIIVKRDCKQESLATGIKPTYVISGKTIRYDVYETTI